MDLPQLDTRFWLTQDEAWMAQRNESWPELAFRLEHGLFKSPKAMKILQAYYLTGALPDFKALGRWQNDERHLDLFCFLWLHPSWDPEVLTALRNAYISSSLVAPEDIWMGIDAFIHRNTRQAAIYFDARGKVSDKKKVYTGHNGLLFDVMVAGLADDDLPASEERTLQVWQGNVGGFIGMGQWLIYDRLNYINHDCLYQHEPFLEFWYQGFTPLAGAPKKYKASLELQWEPIKTALYRIHQFNAEQEGDSCRSRCVLKVRDMLDNRPFIPEIKQLWQDVKAGNVVVEHAWINIHAGDLFPVKKRRLP